MSIDFKRRVVQAFSLLALHSSWGPTAKWLCVPVLSCHSCALAWFACPIGIFAHAAGWQILPMLALGTVLVLGVLLGRLFCGWICPFGTLQDVLYKIPGPKFDLPHWTSYIKYPVLIGSVLVTPYLLGADTMFQFCRVCPASALQVTVPSLVTDGMQTASTGFIVRMSVLGVVIALAIMSTRSFCKVLCPIGALLAPLNYLSFWSVKVPTQNCLACKKCDSVCAMDGSPAKLISEGIPPNRQAECIYCYKCRDACPIHSKNGQCAASCPSLTPTKSERIDEPTPDPEKELV